MKITKLLATAAGLAALTACGGGDTASENMDANLDANLTDMNAGMDMNMPADNMTLEANNVTVVEGANATTDMNAGAAVDANAAATANTTNTL